MVAAALDAAAAFVVFDAASVVAAPRWAAIAPPFFSRGKEEP